MATINLQRLQVRIAVSMPIAHTGVAFLEQGIHGSGPFIEPWTCYFFPKAEQDAEIVDILEALFERGDPALLLFDRNTTVVDNIWLVIRRIIVVVDFGAAQVEVRRAVLEGPIPSNGRLVQVVVFHRGG